MFCFSAFAVGHLSHELVITDMVAEDQQKADVVAMQDMFKSMDAAEATEGPTTDPELMTESPTAEEPAEDLTQPGALIRKHLVHGEPFGVVYIPRLGDDWAFPLIEGTDQELLDRGITHESYTALPGTKGNFGIAGHRVTHGKPLNQIHTMKAGDQIIVETVEGWAVYSMTSHEIVKANATEVYGGVPPKEMKTDSSGAWLSMVACHPMFESTHRYVVFARLVERRPREMGPPLGAPDSKEVAPTPVVVPTVKPPASSSQTTTETVEVVPTQERPAVRPTDEPAIVEEPSQVVTETTYETIVETIYETPTP